MENKIYSVEPVFQAKYWGGQALRARYGYESGLPNIAIAYHVIALPGHGLDNVISGTGETLSQFYANHAALFCCDSEKFPVRMDSENNVEQLSIQLHPNDAYCLAHEGERGKVECSILVQGDGDHMSIRGHHAKTREEFRRLVEEKAWDKLLRVVKIHEGEFKYTPLGTLHGSPSKPSDPNVVSLCFETNSDITYRLYDYDRNISDRPLHTEKIIDTVNIPDDQNYGVPVTPRRANGCTIYDYLDLPGAVACFRLQTDAQGSFEREQFMFMFCIEGKGTVNGYPLKKGETIFIPYKFGRLALEGNLDLGVVSYTNVQ